MPPLLTAVETTLGALETTDADSAAIELARIYARQLDSASAVRAQADRALKLARESGDEALVELVDALRAKLGEQTCVDRIGARLHALLNELQATPKSRGGTRAPAAPVGGSKLAKLRRVQ